MNLTVADARFCKPLDHALIRELAKSHEVLVTVEEGSVGGFGSHVAHFLAVDGLLDGKLKVQIVSNIIAMAYVICLMGVMMGVQWRPMVLPDRYIEHGGPADQLVEAGLTPSHIAATVLNVVGKAREALQIVF